MDTLGSPRQDMDDGSRLTAQSQWLQLLLLHLAGPRVRARVEIDDLVQEIFLRTLSWPAGLPAREPGEQPLRRVLQRIARNSVMDVLRAIRAAKRHAGEVRLSRSDWSRTGLRESGLAAAGVGPGTAAGLAEEERALMRTFESLAGDHRRVIGLRQFEGLSAREVAARMGRSEVAVHSLYRRALQAWAEART